GSVRACTPTDTPFRQGLRGALSSHRGGASGGAIGPPGLVGGRAISAAEPPGLGQDPQKCAAVFGNEHAVRIRGRTTSSTATADHMDKAPTRRPDPLLPPARLKKLTLRTRIMSTSHAATIDEGALPKERYQRYREEKAKGGIGLTMFGGSS